MRWRRCRGVGERVGRLVDVLETLGYVPRRPRPHDRRSKLIVPTEHGRDEQQQADRILAEIEDRQAARIGSDNYADFRRDRVRPTRWP